MVKGQQKEYEKTNNVSQKKLKIGQHELTKMGVMCYVMVNRTIHLFQSLYDYIHRIDAGVFTLFLCIRRTLYHFTKQRPRK